MLDQFVPSHDGRRSAETFRDQKYLGTRVGVDGSVGEYVGHLD